jgi:hypothetical protein
MQHKQASSRRLASLLGERLRARGVRVGLDHLQRLVSGKARRIRVEVMQAMDEMMRSEVGSGELEQLLEQEPSTEHALDLAWVQAHPIRELAQTWVGRHEGATMRQLALRVAQTVRRMGYSTSHNTIQPILGGWKQRTRGYVYRAMLMQFEDGRSLEVPREHVLATHRGREDDDEVSEGSDDVLHSLTADADTVEDVTVDGFVQEAEKDRATQVGHRGDERRAPT